jgi:excisionase family DNA binding protein
MTTWLSTTKAAALLEVSPSTIRRLVDDDELHARRKTRNGAWLVSRESVEQYLDEIESGERQAPAYEEGFAAGYDEGVRDAEGECSDDEDDDGDIDDDDDDLNQDS